MAAVTSQMIKVGTKLENFSLVDPAKENKVVDIYDLTKDKNATCIIFTCNHCPFVKHIRETLIKLKNLYSSKNILFIAVNSNDVKNYPDDSPEKMIIEQNNFPYMDHYLFDETQEFAKSLQAACTPDFYIFDKELKLYYRGQLDDSRPGIDTPVSGIDLIAAFDDLLDNKEPTADKQIPSMGCNIKWKAGNQPSYFG